MAEIRVVCERTEKPAAAPAPEPAAPIPMTPARLITTVGISSAPEFALDQPRVNLGRENELVDSLGRIVRRNDLFFAENAHEANSQRFAFPCAHPVRRGRLAYL